MILKTIDGKLVLDNLIYVNTKIQEKINIDPINKVFRVDFTLFYDLETKLEIRTTPFIFKGVNGETNPTKTTHKPCLFYFNSDETKTEHNLMIYLSQNSFVFPELSDITIVDWGYPNFDTVSVFFITANNEKITTISIEPLNDFVKQWILLNVKFFNKSLFELGFDFIIE